MLPRLLVWSLLPVLREVQALNGTSGPLDECWNQWNKFWTANGTVSYSSTRLRAPPTTTTYITAKTEYSTYSTQYTSTWTHTYRRILGPAGDPNDQSQNVTTKIVDTYYGPVSTPVDVGSSYTTTATLPNTASYYSYAPIYANVSTPSCTLPAQYPPCQSQWDAWAGADIRADGIQQPLCSQAKIEGSSCQHVISNYYSGVGVFGATGIPGWVTSGESTFWPTTQAFAPGCTLGCQQCAIMGDKVRILYWPAGTATAVENGTATATVPLRTGSGGNMSGVQTTVLDGNTLTSPTIYISYKTLYASNSCSGVGRTLSNTIIPLTRSDDLHSLAYKALGDFGAGPGMNGVQYLSWEYEERPFNFTDLQEPIPDAVFDQLPYCQMQYRGYTLNGMQDSMTYSCSTVGPYNPVIAVPPEVRNLDPAWKTCTGWYAGLYDPPRALHPAPSAATPTVPVDPTSAAAEPVASVTNDAPRHTDTESSRSSATRPAPSNGRGSDAEATADPVASTSTDIAGFIISGINGGGAVSSQPDGVQEGSSQTTAWPGNSELSAEIDTTTDDPGVTRTIGVSAAPQMTSRPSTANPGHVDPQTGSSPHTPSAGGSTDRAKVTFEAGGTKHTIHDNSEGPVLDGQTFTQGQVATLASRTLSIGASEVFIDGSATLQYTGHSEPTYAAALTLDGATVTAWKGGSGGVVVDGSSFSEGDRATVHGIAISVAPNGVIAGSQTVGFSALWPASTFADHGPAPLMTAPLDTSNINRQPVYRVTVSDSAMGSSAFTAVPLATFRDAEGHHRADVIIGDRGDILTQGAPPTVIDGLRMSLGTGGVIYTLPNATGISASSVASRSSAVVSNDVQTTESAEASVSATSGAVATSAAERLAHGLRVGLMISGIVPLIVMSI